MTFSDGVMIGAVLLAPLLAVQVQKWVEFARERHNAKLKIFHILMATRAARLTTEHVEALNRIDLEFYGPRTFTWFRKRSQTDQDVLDAWKIYLDELGTDLGEKPTDAQLETWGKSRDEKFVELLYRLAIALDYKYDKVQLKRAVYQPRAFGENILESQAIRRGMARIVSGEAALPVTAWVNLPPDPPAPEPPTSPQPERSLARPEPPEES